jgi:hypothetical protein
MPGKRLHARMLNLARRHLDQAARRAVRGATGSAFEVSTDLKKFVGETPHIWQQEWASLRSASARNASSRRSAIGRCRWNTGRPRIAAAWRSSLPTSPPHNRRRARGRWRPRSAPTGCTAHVVEMPQRTEKRARGTAETAVLLPARHAGVECGRGTNQHLNAIAAHARSRTGAGNQTLWHHCDFCCCAGHAHRRRQPRSAGVHRLQRGECRRFYRFGFERKPRREDHRRFSRGGSGRIRRHL